MPKKTLKGIIKSWSGPQTVKVEVTRTFHHPRYMKRVEVQKRYLAHLTVEASVGQKVLIEETRPISKRKKWLVVELEDKRIVPAKAEVVKEEPKKTVKKKPAARKKEKKS